MDEAYDIVSTLLSSKLNEERNKGARKGFDWPCQEKFIQEKETHVMVGRGRRSDLRMDSLVIVVDMRWGAKPSISVRGLIDILLAQDC